MKNQQLSCGKLVESVEKMVENSGWSSGKVKKGCEKGRGHLLSVKRVFNKLWKSMGKSWGKDVKKGGEWGKFSSVSTAFSPDETVFHSFHRGKREVFR